MGETSSGTKTMAENPVVLYEDNHCIAAAKPAALLTQSAAVGIPSLEAQVKAYLREKYEKRGNVYLGIPHRLDRPVSGVVLFARSTKSAQRLAEQFRKRQVEKVYWAIVEGSVQPEEGRWEDWLLKVAEEARSVVVPESTAGARRAVLCYRLSGRSDNQSWLEIRPETGRMHQIRVQSAARGWPIHGDRTYGSTADFGPPVELARDRMIALHARSLTFLHPIRYEPVMVTAPLPAAWSQLTIPWHSRRET
jgi:23S rRNA pseudouridine1911/1915/1917 synthase